MTERAEYCQHNQDDYEVFVRDYYTRRGLNPPARIRAYPVESVPPLDREHAQGWRVAVYTMDGHVSRIFPFTARLARVVGRGMFGPTGTAELRELGSDYRYWPLTAELVAECDHRCWPIPNPACGCGIHATPTPLEAGVILRHAINNGRCGFDRWSSQPIVYRADMWDVYVRDVGGDPFGARLLADAKKEGWVEYIAARARIAGPILTTSPEAATDLEARGFDAEHVADGPEELAAHLESLTTQETP